MKIRGLETGFLVYVVYKKKGTETERKLENGIIILGKRKDNSGDKRGGVVAIVFGEGKSAPRFALFVGGAALGGSGVQP